MLDLFRTSALRGGTRERVGKAFRARSEAPEGAEKLGRFPADVVPMVPTETYDLNAAGAHHARFTT